MAPMICLLVLSTIILLRFQEALKEARKNSVPSMHPRISGSERATLNTSDEYRRGLASYTTVGMTGASPIQKTAASAAAAASATAAAAAASAESAPMD